MSEKTGAEKEERHAATGEHQEAQPTPEQESAPPVEPAAVDSENPGGGDRQAQLEVELAESQAKAEDNWNQYLRALAELENTRKRASRDVEQAHRYALERFAAELLPVKDSLEMGLNAASDASDKTGALLEGTEMTLKQMTQVFEKFGITELDPKGEHFDPEQHEAMATQPSADAEPDTVLTVVQKGYILNGRVLRPARVLVARPPADDGEGQ